MRASRERLYIVCSNPEQVANSAKRLGVDIPYPFSYGEFARTNGGIRRLGQGQGVLIDDAERLLQYMCDSPIFGMSMTGSFEPSNDESYLRYHKTEHQQNIKAFVSEIQRKYPFVYRVRHFFEIDPCAAPRMTRSDRFKERDCVMKYFSFRNELGYEANRRGYNLEGVTHVIFVVPMPASWSKKKKDEMFLSCHLPRPDRDNYLKAYQDTFGEDDSHVWDGRTTKIWGYFGGIIIYDHV